MTINIKIALKHASAAWCNGEYVGLLLIRSGFDAAPDFDFFLNMLGFLYVIWNGVK